MIPLHPRFVIDEHECRESVVLSLPEWNAVLEELEELDDIRSYDAAKAESQEAIPFDQAVREIEGEYQP